MPRYDFLCNACGAASEEYRPFAEMDRPVACACGAERGRQFTPNGAIHIPIAFQSVRKGGLEGGYSWSDFYGDTTEKELAHMRDRNGHQVEVIPMKEMLSQAAPSPDDSLDHLLAKSFQSAVDKVGPVPPGEGE